jgi:sugar lactone lactonase YvrE
MNYSRSIVVSLVAAFLVAAVILVALPVFAAQSPNTISTIVGGKSVQGLNPTAADVPGPTSVVKDATGELFVAAPYSRDVLKVSGNKIGVFAGQGWGGYSGDGGPPIKAVLGLPYSVAMDPKGELFIADTGNSRIRMVANGIITTVAGSGQKCADPTRAPFCNDGGPATAGLLNLPVAIAVDASGNIYIADSNDDEIRFVNRTSAPITISGKTIQPGNIDTIAGNGNPCSTSGCGNGGSPLQATLTLPSGVAVDASGNIYIADSKDQMVREIPAGPNSNIILFAGSGTACPTPTATCGDGAVATGAKLRLPNGLAVDKSGNVYIADTNDNRIRVVNTQNASITVDLVTIAPGNIATVAGTGAQGFAGDGGVSTSASLDIPQGIYVDSAGNQYISDTGNQRVRLVINSTAIINTVVGGGSGDGNGTNASLAAPNDIIKDSSGNLIIADEVHNRIRKVDTAMNVTTWVGNGSAGVSADGTALSNTQMNAPTSVALDPSGNLLIVDSNNLMVREVLNGSSTISTAAGNGGYCNPTDNCGDGGLATSANFTFPLWVTTDATGNIIIADYFGNRIRAVNPHTASVTIYGVTIPGGQIATVAGTGAQCGSYSKCGDGGPATSALLYHPSAVAVDSSSNLYICDQYDMRIREVDATTGIITRYALNGAAHLGGNGGPALNGSMWNPLAIAMDPLNNLFISGGNDALVQMVDAATEYFGTVAGNPLHADQSGFSGDGGPATAAKISPVGVAVDASGNLYIADFGNNRIRYVPLAPALGPISNAPLQFGAWAIGTTSTPLFVNITGGSGGTDTSLTWAVSGTNPGDFNPNVGTCPQPNGEIAPYRTCTVGVTFTPGGDGPRKATLTLTSNVPGSVPTVINLSGSGPDFTISADPTSVTINPGNSGTSTLTVTPLGDFTQKVTFMFTGVPQYMQASAPAVTPDGVDPITTIATFKTLGLIAPGTYTITISAQSSPLIHPVTVTVTVP